ncbi:uncharacterized protein N0V89_000517 [Didymosphaeria variabile]|uniref:Major facilitator superfamily (MFS) profile domain-containing protein n=1 Tax=Didymosphaeria variabile TaxID=1932322 RepID=A0A9W9CF07_9PLEO|nr:uncharacterized protein N0V89_000517 [Didymosphaeria variabile]KAJ4359958.1 hypothetical protein N0V89_000517 [Didymosphaeria variabile]
MAAEIAHPGPGLHALSTRTSVDAAPTTNPDTPQKSVEDLTASNNSIPDMERAQEKEGDAPVVDEFLVEFNGQDDPDHPKNWTTRRRWGITVVVGLLVFTVTFASSIFSVNIGVVEEKFQVTQVVATLGVALFVLGFVFGPIAFGPMSEVLGRRTPLLCGYALFAIFQIPVAVAQNITTVCVGRFLGGFFAAAPLSVVGGILADLWDPIPRSYAICIFAAGGFAGPVAGPIAGGFITQSYLGWRWTSWITLIMAGVVGALAFFFAPETSAPRILQYRAAALRKKSGNNDYHAKADDEKLTMERVLTVYLIRPFVMIMQEPILALVTAYMSFLYGIVYLLFEAYPVAYHEQRGWSLGVSQLPFTAFIVGIILGAGVIAYSTATNFTRAFNKHGKSIPEERLPPMIVGAICLPVGLFWFGCMSYLIDCYGFYANSAIAVNTFIRSFFGAFFPLFTHVMYTKLGVAWASSLLAFICVAFLPVPVLFYAYGAKIREKSKWAPTGK